VASSSFVKILICECTTRHSLAWCVMGPGRLAPEQLGGTRATWTRESTTPRQAVVVYHADRQDVEGSARVAPLRLLNLAPIWMWFVECPLLVPHGDGGQPVTAPCFPTGRVEDTPLVKHFFEKRKHTNGSQTQTALGRALACANAIAKFVHVGLLGGWPAATAEAGYISPAS